MKRKLMAVLVLLVIAVGLATAACGGQGAPTPTPTGTATPTSKPTATAAVIKLKYATFHPSTSPAAHGQTYCIQWLERESGGRLKIDMYYAQSLVKGAEEMEAIRDGVMDITITYPGYHPGNTPLATVLTIPGVLNNSDPAKGGLASERVMKNPLLVAEIDKFNARLLGVLAPSLYNLMGKVPVRTTEDLKGKRVRASGEVGDLLAAFGAVPINVMGTETYDALSKGMIELVSGPGDYFYKAYRAYELSAYYMYDIDMAPANSPVVINKNSWNKLPADIQAVFNKMEAEKIWALSSKEAISGKITEQWRAEFKAAKVQFIEFPAAEKAKMTAKAGDVWNTWIKRWDDRGVKGAKEILEYAKESTAWAEKQYPQDLAVPDDIVKGVAAVRAAAGG